MAAASPADERAAFPRYAEWLHLRTHGEWSNGVPDWARDHTGRMNDFTAASAVIEELAARAAASPAAEAVTIPAEVIAWRDAYQAHVDASTAYHSLLRHAPVGTDTSAEYRTMNEAEAKVKALIKPMYEALSGMTNAPASPALCPCPSQWSRPMTEDQINRRWVEVLLDTLSAEKPVTIGPNDASCFINALRALLAPTQQPSDGVVNVRDPYPLGGSRDLFWASPHEDDSGFEPSDLRVKVDAARAQGGDQS
ncbi:hypothetical protein WK77_16315 [Burkholderia ubonensis]|nr:hypothetical protein WK77_16315 [Burkholderia ubonensis]